jgi:hypothetical protein
MRRTPPPTVAFGGPDDQVGRSWPFDSYTYGVPSSMAMMPTWIQGNASALSSDSSMPSGEPCSLTTSWPSRTGTP